MVVVAICLAVGCAAGRIAIPPAGCSLAAAWWGAGAGMVIAWSQLVRRRPGVAAACLGAAVACTGAAWSAARFDLFPADELAWNLGETPVPVAIRGTVVEMPRPLPAPIDDPA
ncbi:MAG: hypothetical protein EBR23_14025, partial [Planctomycetia bacterium]|nr:hypothetical protein [Planctomycetia bacterium]